ncbi:hypothetical protein SPSIL_015010 [Sporomusa silvacetica DSM 10669]|uniref:Uncharacterized protein n=1 Tax=Sporomusa silvacetica DSM 10669 TaxID=1123289 RepID=A0ABZ3II96_9FIRM|nr:hypothetical protein [Sporomusa silvacetica]OZC21563.1 hypothetical protein SPSIL_09740 [Sporomusa silvacetica DSM 10669]
MNMLPINQEYKRRQRWAEKQERKGDQITVIGRACCEKAKITVFYDSTVIACPEHKAEVIHRA